MRAARIMAPGEIAVEEVPIPVPGRGEIRIRLEGCGVCASNLGPWRGLPWQQYPMEPGGAGHEGWGVVDAVGDGVTELRAGDRVAALSYHAYAEYDTLSARAAIALAGELAGRPFPGEPLGCAMNVFARSGIEAGQIVAVVGVGFLGSLLVQLAAAAGARVIAISRRTFALETALRMGAAQAIPMRDHDEVLSRVRELTDGAMCHRVIEAVGKQWPLDLAGSITGERGTLIIAGYHQDGPRQVNMQMWNWRGIDVVNAHERDPDVYVRGIRAAQDAVLSGRLSPFGLCTHTFPLEQLGTALDATAARPEGFMKALVAP